MRKFYHNSRPAGGTESVFPAYAAVAVLVPDGLLVAPQPLRIRKTPIEEYINNGYDIAVLTPKWETPETAQARAEAFESMIGRFYGALDLVWFILPAWLRRTVSIDMPGEFCSEMVAKAMEITGELKRITNKKTDHVFPADFSVKESDITKLNCKL